MNAARQNRTCSRVLYWQCVKTFAELSTIRLCAKRDFPIAPTCSAAYGLAFWLKEVIRNWRYDRTLLDTHFIDDTIFKLLRVLAVLGVILWAAVCVMALVYILRRRCKKSSPEGA